MTYEEFKKELYHNVSALETCDNRQVRLFEKGQLQPTYEEALRGKRAKMVQEDCLCVQWNRRNPGSMKNWNIHALYERYRKEGWQGVLPEVMGSATFEEQLILRPTNYKLNREALMEGIYWQFGEIALVLYSQMGTMEDEKIAMKVQRSMMDKWRISPEKLFTTALLNSYAKMPPRLFMSGNIKFSYDWDEGVFMPGEAGKQIIIDRDNAEEAIRGYRLTTTEMKYGAISIFYPGVQERIAQLLKDDYLVGFTSVHEAVIHPVSHKNPGKMKSAIQHINTVYDEQDMLTNMVYRYCRKRQKMLEL